MDAVDVLGPVEGLDSDIDKGTCDHACSTRYLANIQPKDSHRVIS